MILNCLVLSVNLTNSNEALLDDRFSRMSSLANIPTVSHIIQLAVAPVFLLTGIGSILGVLTNRLGRAVDRFRMLNELETSRREIFQREMGLLSQRLRYIHRAISLCTLSALCICLSVAAMFISVELELDLSQVVALLFVLAMLTLILGLLFFLREVALATCIFDIGKK